MTKSSVKLLWWSKGRAGFVPILLHCSCELSSCFDRDGYPHPATSVDSCPNIPPNHASTICLLKNYISHVFAWMRDPNCFLKCKDRILSPFLPSSLLFAPNCIILVASLLTESPVWTSVPLRKLQCYHTFIWLLEGPKLDLSISWNFTAPIRGRSRQRRDSSLQGHQEADRTSSIRI